MVFATGLVHWAEDANIREETCGLSENHSSLPWFASSLSMFGHLPGPTMCCQKAGNDIRLQLRDSIEPQEDTKVCISMTACKGGRITIALIIGAQTEALLAKFKKRWVQGDPSESNLIKLNFVRLENEGCVISPKKSVTVNEPLQRTMSPTGND